MFKTYIVHYTCIYTIHGTYGVEVVEETHSQNKQHNLFFFSQSESGKNVIWSCKVSITSFEVQKRAPFCCLGDFCWGWFILHSYIGILVNHEIRIPSFNTQLFRVYRGYYSTLTYMRIMFNHEIRILSLNNQVWNVRLGLLTAAQLEQRVSSSPGPGVTGSASNQINMFQGNFHIRGGSGFCLDFFWANQKRGPP